ncbi:MAG: DUF934 domain-containing protein [Rhodobacteraceae bacterium]|nr:DUF934 domain-containing protein [Paracoccaceae bacterium]
MTETRTVIVRDDGFHREDFTGEALAIAPDTRPADLPREFGNVGLIAVDFPAFSDGRGFTLGQTLRRLGYAGRLRARGNLIPDQYAMARRAGFDEVEITAERAARQPEADWLRRADWRAHDYRSRVRG